MNYDINTDEGMENAARWVQATFDMIRTGGNWAIPRSGTIVTVDHTTKTAYIIKGHTPEPDTERVIKHMGWEVSYL